LRGNRLSYPCGIAERAMFLKSLYEQLGDKTKIHLKKKVVGLRHEQDCVKVLCADGTEVVGSVIIGADGIHSKVREEIQRLGEVNGQINRDKFSVKAEYNCIFGISDAVPSLSPGDGHIASDVDNSSLVFVSRHGKANWFLFSKMDKIYPEGSIPRLTESQMKAKVEKFKDFHFTEDVRLKDMIDRSTSLSYVPLEEATFENWTYGRAVCVGDSIHKMTPNMGQGGNQAIESAAVLTNCLLKILNQTKNPTNDDIETALRKYQDLRQKRAKHFVKMSGLVSRDETLATLRHTLRFLYFPLPSSEMFANMQTYMYTSAPYLKFLPLPKRLAGNKYWNEGLAAGEEMDLSRARL
ncbi:FAD-dependent monooxygenase paxM, partial [Lachnellula suecica]